ncbi:MAG TPA: ABC transporter substrate-binding protein [Pseudonocardiaceae bacterium]|jgi:iron complex transport system substrate-binding protein|nr:ABC transporter substrate-binding protein [Pseudonocardiaceae bacterium]
MSRHLPKHGFRTVIGLFTLVGTVLVAGCASHAPAGPASTASSAGSAFPVTVTVPGGNTPVTIATRPKRIVSLDATDTEILYEVGAGKQVVAVDKDSDYPANAPHTSLDSTNPNIEAIAGYNPDLVVTAYNENNVVSGLQKLKIPVLFLPAPEDVNDAYALWSAIGRATGHQSEADGLVSAAKQQIAKIVETTPKPTKPLSYYYEVDQTLYTATSHTFIGQLIGQFGLTNIADPADTASAAGYPQLSGEQVFAANPSIIFLADSICCGQNAATIAARPGWHTLSAVEQGNVVALNDDDASRWSQTRILDLMHAVSTAVAKAGK